jgi:hypothetical protein
MMLQQLVLVHGTNFMHMFFLICEFELQILNIPHSCNHYNTIVTNIRKSYCNSSRWFSRSSNSYYKNIKGVIGGSVQKQTGSTNSCLHPIVDGGDGAIDLVVVTWVAAVMIRVPKRHGRRVPIATG